MTYYWVLVFGIYGRMISDFGCFCCWDLGWKMMHMIAWLEYVKGMLSVVNLSWYKGDGSFTAEVDEGMLTRESSIFC